MRPSSSSLTVPVCSASNNPFWVNGFIRSQCSSEFSTNSGWNIPAVLHSTWNPARPRDLVRVQEEFRRGPTNCWAFHEIRCGSTNCSGSTMNSDANTKVFRFKHQIMCKDQNCSSSSTKFSASLRKNLNSPAIQVRTHKLIGVRHDFRNEPWKVYVFNVNSEGNPQTVLNPPPNPKLPSKLLRFQHEISGIPRCAPFLPPKQKTQDTQLCF